MNDIVCVCVGGAGVVMAETVPRQLCREPNRKSWRTRARQIEQYTHIRFEYGYGDSVAVLSRWWWFCVRRAESVCDDGISVLELACQLPFKVSFFVIRLATWCEKFAFLSHFCFWLIDLIGRQQNI